MTATVTETIKVSPEPPKDDERHLGWGFRSGERRFETAISRGRTYFESKSQYGDGDPADTRIVRLSDRLLTSSRYYNQGSVGHLRGLSYIPLLGSYTFLGKNIDELLRELDSATVRTSETGEVRITGRVRGETLDLELAPSERMRLLKASATERGQPGFVVTVVEVQRIGEDYVPIVTEKLVYPVANQNGATIRSTFHVDRVEPRAQESLFRPDWSEGMRVGDDIEGNVYVSKGGKLVLDPLFSQSARATKQRQGLIIVGGVAAGLIGLGTLLRRRYLKS